MSALRTPAAALALAALLATLAPAARADDTEVFVATAESLPDAGRSNIMFIIDTSASMDSAVQTQVPWNPSTTFSGCYRTDAVYFGTGTQPPPCDSTAFVLKTSNRCAASGSAFFSYGQYTGLALGWDPERERWDPLAEDEPERLLECEADRGIDGAGSERYAANGPGGPWGPDAAEEPAWNTAYTLFDGNWLNWRANPPTVTRTRLQIVQEVVADIVANLQDVNVGLMQFNRDEGGNVNQAVGDVATTRAAMIAAVQGMVTQGRTPLSETLYEAALYLRGGRVDYGNVGPSLSVPASRLNGSPTGATYVSPISAACQKNFIILLTDGEPLGDVSANAKIQALPGFPELVGSCDGTGDGACLDDLADYLFRSDASAGVDGLQNVVTYTIGFGGVDTPLLEATARRGGGKYYLADDTGSLAAVMTDVVGGIVERSGTFAAPSIPVSAFNQGSSARDVYVSVFQPSGNAHWPGNLKKYRLAGTQLTGQDGQSVIDTQTGLFLPDAFSFWSAEPDGGRVPDGGAANRLPVTNDRRPFTDIAGPDLASEANRIAVSNPLLTASLLGVTEESRDSLIRWIRGRDILDIDSDGDTTEPRHQMGDPLHVRPVTLTYGTSAASPNTTVFFSTNDGFLHAVDAETGIERWAYLPSRLLPRQNELLLDPPSAVKRYGLDGEMRLFVENDDGRPGIAGDERAILYFGMGRGGDAVFALDVTARDAPQLLWQVDRRSPGLAGIGQVWAAPGIARVNVGGTVRRVAVVSGGYDDSQDNRGFRSDTIGNAVYLLDAFTGEVLWSAGPPGAGHDLELPDMRNSIPAAPRVLDLSGDGLADRMYVGDMGGRLWRIDLVNGNARASLGEGGVLASLGAADLADPPASAVRRFYATPDVVLVNCLRGTFLAINIGSGYRGHPLDTDVDDQFFSVRDANVFVPVATEDYPADPVAVGELLDITDDPAALVPRDARGWRLRLEQSAGEKILNPAVTFNNTVFFTSFSPGGSVSACVGGLGVNRAYEVDVCNGRALTNLDGSLESEPLGVEDRFRTLSQTGIAPESIFLFPSNAAEGPTRCVGLVCFPPTAGGRTLTRTFWVQEPAR